MLLGCIADDFTGASDLANTLAKGGMRTVQFSGVPEEGKPPECEAGVVALKARSVPKEKAVERALAALEWLRDRGCRQFFFKYCSTFDSTAEGNIGPVAEALMTALGTSHAIVCPVFPATGRTLFMGHLFVGERLLSESGMENHPLTPMRDADIRRWLQRQTRLPVGHVPYAVVRKGDAAIAARIKREVGKGCQLLVTDAVVDDDLHAIARAVGEDTLITGGSGLALGLPNVFRSKGRLRDTGSDFKPVQGRAAILSGSCSATSLAQVEAHLAEHTGLPVAAGDVLLGILTPEAAVAFAREHGGQAPIIYSTADSDTVKAAQAEYGRERVAEAMEQFFGAVAKGLVEDGVRRLAVGGGETSGAVVQALCLQHLFVGPEIDPGVPALASATPHPIALALKSGNFGSRDFYEKALQVLGTP